MNETPLSERLAVVENSVAHLTSELDKLASSVRSMNEKMQGILILWERFSARQVSETQFLDGLPCKEHSAFFKTTDQRLSELEKENELNKSKWAGDFGLIQKMVFGAASLILAAFMAALIGLVIVTSKSSHSQGSSVNYNHYVPAPAQTNGQQR